MHMLRCLNILSMPWMPIGWNGLSMLTEGSSVCMPIVITIFKVQDVKQDSVPYMMKILLTHIHIECGVVDLNVYWFRNGSGYAMVLPSYDGEVLRVSAVSCLGAASMKGWGFL